MRPYGPHSMHGFDILDQSLELFFSSFEQKTLRLLKAFFISPFIVACIAWYEKFIMLCNTFIKGK
jgi:hypothetical protein